jgi:uncharacterized protein (TIGR03083 family)
MKKSEITAALEENREAFLDTIEGLSEEDMQQPGVIPEWSVKDILAHLTRWEAELVKLLWQAGKGQKPTTIHFAGYNVDETNTRWFRESKNRELDRVLEDFHGVRNQTLRRVDELPGKAFEDPEFYPWLAGEPLWRWIAGDSFEHETEHAEQIRVWRETAGL